MEGNLNYFGGGSECKKPKFCGHHPLRREPHVVGEAALPRTRVLLQHCHRGRAYPVLSRGRLRRSDDSRELRARLSRGCCESSRGGFPFQVPSAAPAKGQGLRHHLALVSGWRAGRPRPAAEGPQLEWGTKLDKIKYLHLTDSIDTGSLSARGRSIWVHSSEFRLVDSSVPHQTLLEKVRPLGRSWCAT